jgi:hypothetical protein
MLRTDVGEWVQTWQSVSSVQDSSHAEEAPVQERIHFGVEFQKAEEGGLDDHRGYRWPGAVALRWVEQ